MQTPPGTTLGVVGGGQLGRMLAEAASPLGVDVVVLDPTPDCPAATPAADHIEGAFDDPDAFAELAARSDVLTFEIELADADLLADVDVPVHPKPSTLRTTEDKLAEKEALADAGVPVPSFRRVDSASDLRKALDTLGSPLMLKARHGGYDGRGNHRTGSVGDAEDYFGDLEGLVAEELVDFERELSVIAAKGASENAQFPVVENVHEEEILRETRAPPATTDDVVKRAREVVNDVIDVLEGRGVYGVELFEVDGQVLVNEIAPRPHNSGHYTIEGAVTSQFEQHVRAVLGLPLGDPSLRGPTAMVNVLGDVEETKPARLTGVPEALAVPTAALHWYGKHDVRPLRKMGHVTALGDDVAEASERANDARDALSFE
ncbi:5-(carboxyamino)imidazole ribonucleotide synthase [Halarchaeum sp. P4]|uniref:5-(carboxyamino)imidazole ribonucleotide synthase n=1 Tax=Halarchaeum sp. P4 TaxID=3421639 RepID=UPI003EC09C05